MKKKFQCWDGPLCLIVLDMNKFVLALAYTYGFLIKNRTIEYSKIYTSCLNSLSALPFV